MTIAETTVRGHLTLVCWRPATEVAVLRVDGEVDLLAAPVFRDAMDQVLDRAPLVLVIDLNAVTFFGASGLTVLATTCELVGQSATTLRLVCGTRLVTRPLAVVGLDRIFETYDDLETACRRHTGACPRHRHRRHRTPHPRHNPLAGCEVDVLVDFTYQEGEAWRTYGALPR